MKKIILIFIVGFSFFACKQDNLNHEETTASITARNNNLAVLSFNSVADYQRIFEDKDFLKNKVVNTNFTSLASKLVEYETLKAAEKSTENVLKQETDSLYTDYGVLTKILNEDRIVKIGENYIKVDLPTEQVLVLNENNASEYEKLVNNDIADSHIMVFSTDEQVLDLLASGSKGTVDNDAFRKCSDPYAGPDNKTRYGYAGRRHRIKGQAQYQRAGIYYALVLKGKAQKRRAWIWWRNYSVQPSLGVHYYYEVRCGKTDYNIWYTTTGNDGKVVYRPYEGFVALKYYKVEVGFQSSSGGTSIEIGG